VTAELVGQAPPRAAIPDGADRATAIADECAPLLTELVRALEGGRPTPFLLYDLDRIDENVALFRDVATGHPRLALHIDVAVKAVGLAPLLAQVARRVDGFDVQSPHEATLCPPGASIGFHGPWLNLPPPPSRVTRITCNSAAQWRACDPSTDAAEHPDRRYGIRLDVNVDDDFEAAHDKFGVDSATAAELLATAPADWYLHHHGHRRLHDPAIARTMAAKVTSAAAAVSTLARRELRTLDIGGGFDSRLEARLAGGSVAGALRAQLEVVESELPLVDTVIVEPGRALFEDAGAMATTVVEVIERADHRVLIVDAASNVLVPNPGARFHAVPLGSAQADHEGEWVPTRVADPTCRPRAVISDQLLPATLGVGSVLAVVNAGAYALAFASSFFAPPPPALAIRRDQRAPIDLLPVVQA
jgi:diaminopimelate decarboxylase